MMSTDGDIAGLLLLADARLPVGGHTQSAGFEPAVLAGCTAADVPDFLALRLRTVAAVDLGVALCAYAELDPTTAGPDPDAPDVPRARLAGVHAHWAARTPSQVQRRASEAAGAGMLRLLRRLFPDDAVTEHVAALPSAPRPITYAALGRALGASAREVGAALLHDEVQSVTSAAMKLLPADPVDAVSWALAARGTQAELLATALAHAGRADGIPARSAPLMEVWAHDHDRSNRRLFRA